MTVEYDPNSVSAFNAITVGSAASVQISGLTISDAGSGSAGIVNNGSANVSECTLSSNYLGFDNATSGKAMINSCTITGSSDGGIINAGALTINNSTISGNQVQGAPGITANFGQFVWPAGDAAGGGIYTYAGTLTINSSTIANNDAFGGNLSYSSYRIFPGYYPGNGYGGGLYIASGTVTINNSTFADNWARGGTGYYGSYGDGYGGGIYNAAEPGALQIYDTILADNGADTAGPDLGGVITSLGHNLIGNTSGGSGYATSDLVNVNPQLGPLQNNAGPTQTMALLAGSPAIDAGDNTNAPAYDQRGPGFPRIVNGTIDIGAFEVQGNNSNQASSLTVAGFPSVITAGSAGSFTVTALNADSSTDTSYTGTVHFTSSDSQAILPADYTFTAADAGVHTFSATLKTAGTQSITATDTSGLTGTDAGITVNPAAASRLALTGFPSSIIAGTPGTFTVTAYDAYGNVATSFADTLHFTTSAARSVLPADATLSNGTGQFSATLDSAGTQSLTVTDTTTPSLTATESGISVKSAAASRFVLQAPSSVSAGQSFSLTVTVEDAYGNVVTGYVGTLHFSSTDKRARLPQNYTFTASDRGAHTFTGLVLHTTGNQKITVTDTHNSALTASAIVDVLSSKKSQPKKVNRMDSASGQSASSQDESEDWLDEGLAILSDLAAEDGLHRQQPR